MAFVDFTNQAFLARYAIVFAGFLMLGGAESFRQGNYAGTPIASLLPVYLDRPVTAKLPGEFKLTLTHEGWLEPWVRLRPVESEEQTRMANRIHAIHHVAVLQSGVKLSGR